MGDFAEPILSASGCVVLPTRVRGMWEGHYGPPRNDCLHHCIPGVPDLWNIRFLSMLIRDGLGSKAKRKGGREWAEREAVRLSDAAKRGYYPFANANCTTREMSALKRLEKIKAKAKG